MVISRKPIGAPGAAPAPGPGQLQRQDSWEIYSSDEDEPVVPKPPSNTNYQPYRPPDSYQPPPLQTGSFHPPPQTQPTASNETNGMDQIPESLRPGGPRSQTNPFLRKKVPDSATQPPTQQLAQLNVQNTGSNPFQPQQPQKQDTTGSSNYDGTPNTVSSETNPWKTNQLDPNRTYSPASAAVLQESKGDAPPTILQSPVDMAANPWVDAPTSIPQAPAQPPPAPPQAPAQPPPAPPAPQIPQPVQPPQPPQPPQLESNPWSAGANIPAPPLPPSPAPPAPVAQPPTEPPAPPLPPSPQPPPKFEPPPSAPALLVPQAPPSQPSTPAYSDTNPFVHNGSPQPPRSQSRSPAMMSVASEGSGFVDVSQGKFPQTQQGTDASAASASNNGAWEGLDVLEQQQTGQSKAADSQIEEWKLVDVDGPSSSAAQEGESSQPPLPPRRQSGDRAGLVSPRPNVDPKTETYQVKNIKWHDPTSSQNPRVSPILVQNENGPCPLVALVNALTLTTPHDAGDSSLVEVLRSREQISLNLLLDAVFEELMSPRRSDEDAILPDVGELYAFLMSLHTGMNVNPRFMPTAAMREAFGRTSLTHLDAADRNSLIPGTFENTHEMGLYATFKIPLIHGWLPLTNDPAYSALERQAPSYEDAQNILFHEEELEHKLSSPQGLNGEEQQLYQDIMTIKGFLEDSATQLTAWGIQVIAKAIRPGTFAILFRNDHFSTLYCHPQSKELVTLVTDEGYRSNDEVVWESLVDIRGERTQYLSGDFRVVGQGASSTSGGLSDANAGEWQTVGSRRGGTQQQNASDEPPLTPAEQEDRDLALAMQLQEEEDQRHREEQDRRQREQNMSNQYIEQQGRGPQTRASSSQYPGNSPSRAQQLQSQGIAPNRRSSASSSLRPGSAVNQPRQTLPRQPSQNIRPMVPPRRHVPNTHRPEAAGADAPPPYEQAAHDEPFEPPLGHPAHATSTNASQQSVNAASVNTPPRIQRPAGQNIPPAFQGRPTAAGREGRDRDCVVM